MQMAITPKSTAAANKKANAGGGNMPVSKKISGGSSFGFCTEPGPRQPSAAAGAAAVSGSMKPGNSKMVSMMNESTQCMQMTPQQKRRYNK